MKRIKANGICDLCHSTTEILNPTETVMKDGKILIRGECDVCGSKVGMYKEKVNGRKKSGSEKGKDIR